jgi:hypothetical protein
LQFQNDQEIETLHGDIRMRAGLSGAVRIVEVSDIGTGVLADVLSFIDNQFFLVDSSSLGSE